MNNNQKPYEQMADDELEEERYTDEWLAEMAKRSKARKKKREDRWNALFPMTVTAIEWSQDRDNPISDYYSKGECGDLVAVLPCSGEGEGKTHLGILLGEMPVIGAGTRYDEETQVLTISMGGNNPAIFIPSLKRVVFGMGSYWHLIENEDELKEITADDINNTWYIRMLGGATAAEKKPDQTTHDWVNIEKHGYPEDADETYLITVEHEGEYQYWGDAIYRNDDDGQYFEYTTVHNEWATVPDVVAYMPTPLPYQGESVQ